MPLSLADDCRRRIYSAHQEARSQDPLQTSENWLDKSQKNS